MTAICVHTTNFQHYAPYFLPTGMGSRQQRGEGEICGGVGSGQPELQRYGKVAGGARARASDCQGVEAPWSLALAQKSTCQETKNQNMQGFRRSLRQDKTGSQGGGTCYRLTNKGPTVTCEQEEGQKVWGQIVTVNGGRCRHATRGADTSGGGLLVVGVGNVQVGDALHLQSKCRAGDTQRAGYENECMLMRKRNIQKRWTPVGREGQT